MHLGLPQLVDRHLDLGNAPGRANTGDKIVTLVASALADGDCIDDADALRAGGTARVLAGTVKAPSTIDASSASPDGSPVRPRRLTLHLPPRWPWEAQFSRVLARLRVLPFPA